LLKVRVLTHYHDATKPGQIRKAGWRLKIFYRDQWREISWKVDGP